MAYIATQRLVTGHRRIAMKIHPTDGLAEANMPRIWAEPCNPVGTNLWLRPVLSYYDKSVIWVPDVCVSLPSFLPSFLGWLAGWLFLSLSGFAAYLSKDPPSLHNPNPQSQSTRSITPPFRRGDVEGFFPASAGVWHGFLTGRFEHGV